MDQDVPSWFNEIANAVGSYFKDPNGTEIHWRFGEDEWSNATKSILFSAEPSCITMWVPEQWPYERAYPLVFDGIQVESPEEDLILNLAQAFAAMLDLPRQPKVAKKVLSWYRKDIVKLRGGKCLPKGKK